MTDDVMAEIERVVTEVEAEIKANPNRTWTIVTDAYGELVAKCPWCEAVDEIHEHDVGIRWNQLTIESQTSGRGRVADEADWNEDGWVCGACGTQDLDAPEGFRITEWD